MTLVDLAGHLASADDDRHRWRLVAEMLEEHRYEPEGERVVLLTDGRRAPATSFRSRGIFVAPAELGVA